jgi:hypothetical protein
MDNLTSMMKTNIRKGLVDENDIGKPKMRNNFPVLR